MRALFAFIALALLCLSYPSPVGAGGDGVIEGTVTNGSEGGGPVGELEVTLITDPAAAGESTARTNPLGRVRFDGLSTYGEDVYALAVRYQGVDYTVGGIQIDAQNPSRQVEMHVYETTTSAEAVTVLLDHQTVRARPHERRLEVVTYVEVTNGSDRTVVSHNTGDGAGGALCFALPEGAENVEFLGALSQEGVLLDERLSNLNQAIPPGEHELMFAYELSYAGDSFVFRKRLDYPTDKTVFLMSAREAEAESQQLPAAKEVDTAAGAQQILTGEHLPAGTVLEVTLTGLPTGGGTSLSGLLGAAAVILAILLIGAVVVYVRFRRRPVPTSPQER